MSRKLPIIRIAALTAACIATTSQAADWPEWGRDNTKNMVSPVTGLPSDFTSGEREKGSDNIDLATAKHAKWIGKLGSQSYGTPTIAEGVVIVGTNNEEPRNEAIQGDRGVIMAFDENTGEFLWQLATPKLGAGKVSDWEYLGMCSSALIKDGLCYIVTNRGEILALDMDGMKDGNDGPYMDEAIYMSKGLDGQSNEPMVEPGDTDADIIWGFDIRSELGVFPHNVTSSSVTTDGKNLYVSTSNGVDWSHINVPAPLAPSMIVLDLETGELVGEEASGIGPNIMHCNWSSPAFVEHDGKPMVIFGAGDGFLYGYNPETEKDADGFDILPEYFSYDANKPEYRFNESGEPIKYATYPGPSEIISTPVYHGGKIYVAIGQDPEHGEGLGLLSAVDASSEGDIPAVEGAVWTYDGVKRTISTPSVTDDGLVFLSDYSGVIHCLDAETGELYWIHDTLSHIWGSTMVADGKVFLGNEDGELIILPATKDADKDGNGEVEGEEMIATVEFPAPIYSSPIAANGKLFVATQTHLYVYEQGAE